MRPPEGRTLIGAEGITAEGSYTWSNQRLLYDSALQGGVQGERSSP
jgi:hypothetical protein